MDVRNNNSETFRFSTDTNKTYGHITHLINYGTIKASFWISNNSGGVSTLTNYGYIGGGISQKIPHTMTLNNLGIIAGQYGNANLGTAENGKILIQNYMLKINESAMKFNSFENNGNGDKNSHLVISGNNGSVRFKDGDSKIILDFGDNFEFGAGYLISKIATDTSGNPYSDLGVNLSRLVPRSDIYYLTQSGNSFIVHLAPQYSAIGNLYKANVRTMNNFTTISNSMIYPRKYSKSQNLGRKKSSLQHSPSLASGNHTSSPSLARGNSNASPSLAEGARGWVEYPSLRMSEANVAIQDLNTNETFFYQNKSQNLQTRRIQRQKRNYSRNVKDSSLRADSQNLRGNPKDLRTKRSNHPQNFAESKPYYFILTPFINHNLFFQSGRYNLSGFDYGFLTAFSGKLTPSNTLGAHFIMSYGTLGDSSDKNFHISNLNLNLGLNYKLDLVYDMFLKVRGDVFYFANALDSATIKNIKPSNLGFGASVLFGKDFDFKQGGVLGIEGGIDYKALSASEITLDSMSETYQKSLYNVLYVDLGISYAKYFGNFGFNANLGIKGNITANKLAKSQIILKNFNRSVDMVLDNDKVLGYANVALSYVLNHKNFDMEFSLAYYGNFGDRVISNGGGFEWRVGW